MLFVVTGADRIEQPALMRERYIEYVLALHRIFSYKIPVFGVLSEVNTTKDTPPFHEFPFTLMKTIDYGKLDGYGKSQKEFVSLATLVNEMENLPIQDDEFVIKISGRYMLVNDSFFHIVKDAQQNPQINTIIRLCDNDTQQYTFLYAIRYKYFKQFYRQDVSILKEGKNIERATLEFLYENHLFTTTLAVNSLGILANINNENTFKVY